MRVASTLESGVWEITYPYSPDAEVIPWFGPKNSHMSSRHEFHSENGMVVLAKNSVAFSLFQKPPEDSLPIKILPNDYPAKSQV